MGGFAFVKLRPKYSSMQIVKLNSGLEIHYYAGTCSCRFDRAAASKQKFEHVEAADRCALRTEIFRAKTTVDY